MKRNILPLLGIAFVVALAASGIFYGVFVGQLRKAAATKPLPQIAVASHTLDRGTVLTPADLKMTGWAGELPPGAFQSVDAAKGKTLYSSIQENEPLTETQLSLEKATGGLGISKGMRAVSIHVYDSSGLVPFLHAGNRVDVQVVQNRSHPDAVLKTMLQNVEVLSVSKPDPSQMHTTPSIVTLLVSPDNADRVALADSGANIRLLLRNPLDNEEGTRPGMAVGSLFRDVHLPATESVHHAVPPAAVIKPVETVEAPAEETVDFLVQVAGASPATMEQIHVFVPAPNSPASILVGSLPQGDAGERLRKSLQQDMEILSTSRVRGSNLRPAYVETGKRYQSKAGDGCGLSLRLKPRIVALHNLRLRLQPEVTLPGGHSGTNTRRTVAEVDLEDGQSAVVTGLSEPGRTPGLVEELFGDRGGRSINREIVVIITPQMPMADHSTVAAAH
ncbi:MAG: Flp pilus assembly protein CpaB [Acidobacteriaceae bacterium]|nr:Flp pilus assembly protein CpaB [Acidobacteriaceae bacterium]